MEHEQRKRVPYKRTSKRVTDHLANERTFLAWIRTAIAVTTFGFVIARFGLFLRQMSLEQKTATPDSLHFSTIIGVTLTLLGGVIAAMALRAFVRARDSIDREEFYPPVQFAVMLTVMGAGIALVLAIYLLFTQ